MASYPTRSTFATRCGRIGLTSTAGVAALLAVIALPAPIDPLAGRPPAPTWQPPAPASEPAPVVPLQDLAPSTVPSVEWAPEPGRCSLAHAAEPQGALPRITRCGPVSVVTEAPPRDRRRCHAVFSELATAR